jgi:hypothetical protein
MDKARLSIKTKMMVVLKDLKIAGIEISFIQCCNSGNKASQNEYKSKV